MEWLVFGPQQLQSPQQRGFNELCWNVSCVSKHGFTISVLLKTVYTNVRPTMYDVHKMVLVVLKNSVSIVEHQV